METPEEFNVNVKNVKVSVITLCAKTNPIDLKSLQDKLSSYSDFNLTYDPESKKNSGKNNFYNCMDISFKFSQSLSQVTSNISCKIFSNGQIKIAGSRSIEAANAVILYIEKILNSEITNPRIVLINSNFRFSDLIDINLIKRKSSNEIKLNLDQQILKDLINDNHGFATFQPSKYPGINAKICGVTLLIFKSGNVSIFGAKRSSDISLAYKKIVEIALANKDKIFF